MEQQKSNNQQFLLSINETAEVIGIGQQRLRELVRVEPDIPIIVIGSTTKIIIEEFKKWIVVQSQAGRTL